jgi:hypothetical protein
VLKRSFCAGKRGLINGVKPVKRGMTADGFHDGSEKQTEK